MSNEHDALLAAYKDGVKKEIEKIRAGGPPAPIGYEDLPSDVEADTLDRMLWEAASRDSILLYDGQNIYEKHVEALTLSDAREAAAFYKYAAAANQRAADQHLFAADVLEGLQELEAENE